VKANLCRRLRVRIGEARPVSLAAVGGESYNPRGCSGSQWGAFRYRRSCRVAAGVVSAKIGRQGRGAAEPFLGADENFHSPRFLRSSAWNRQYWQGRY
jgi:hypothetical protein